MEGWRGTSIALVVALLAGCARNSSPSPSPTPGAPSAATPGATSAPPAPAASSPSGPVLPASLRPIMLQACLADGTPDAWADSPGLAEILDHESGFDPNAQNPSSTAYGLFQFLDSTWASVGATKTSDPYLQCVAGLQYIHQRYGDPDAAWTFWQAHHWY